MVEPHVLVLPSWYPTVYAPVNGVFFQEQARALRRAGARVGVVYPEFRSWPSFTPGALVQNRFQTTIDDRDGMTEVRMHGWNVPRLRATGPLWVRSALRLVKRYIARCGKPHVIHAHSILWGGVAAHRAKSVFGIPFVVTEHSTAFPRGLIRSWQEPYLRDVCRDADGLIAVSSALGKHIQPFAGEKQVLVVPNRVDVGFFRPPDARPPHSGHRFACVAGLTANKGIDVLLTAFAKAVRDRGADMTLQIGGDGPERRALEALALRLGLEKRVRFLGDLGRKEVRETLWRADTFVLPSRVETFGVVLIEAMATGLPVIATRCGGPEEFVGPETGRLVDPEDVDQLAQALGDAAAERARYDGAAIRRHVVDRFSDEVVTRVLLNTYADVLALGEKANHAP